ncbi:MAG: EamA family transporter RarD [Hyphomonadaceae bacterium]|nr:EamA family transporter RarD [Hyphomonadaceae bacterium]
MGSEFRTGFIAALAAYLLWGALPLYFRALDHIRPDEMLAHRIVWSVPTGLAVVALARSWRTLRALLTLRRLAWLVLSAGLIGANWMVYIWAVSVERVTEASLGYYINPLVSVLMGRILFAERLRPAQWISVGIATTGVVILTVGLGYLPWVALFLCFTFAFYGAVRKHIAVDGRAGFAVEAAILAPAAGLWLAHLVSSGQIGPMGQGGWDVFLLIAAGPITAVPLICFTIAAQRLALSTIGMMQYIAPSLQFAIAVLVFGERFTQIHAVAFGFIWLALVIFTTDSLVGSAKARRLARAARLA